MTCALDKWPAECRGHAEADREFEPRTLDLVVEVWEREGRQVSTEAVQTARRIELNLELNRPGEVVAMDQTPEAPKFQGFPPEFSAINIG